jgi:transposase
VDITITFCQATVKELTRRLHSAFRAGNRCLIKRLSALLLLADQRPVARIAARLGVCKQTIYNWLHAFLLTRYDSLPTRRPPGRPPKLTPAQRQRLCALIDGGPEAAGYATGCWNTALIQDLIQREFQRCYNVHYLAELLHQLGYSYQKARFVSDHLDEVRRQHWLKVTWPAIVPEARRRQALLLFGDEASFAQWGSLGYTWARRGQQPQVKTTGKRKGYKVLGMIEYFSGRLFYRGQTERFTAERYCAFLLMILATTEQPILLIQDGARYHTAKATLDFVAEHAERLQVYQLPSYSPDYNPIEHLWRNVKRDQTHNRYFPSFEVLTQAVEESLTAFQNDRAAVKRAIGHAFGSGLGAGPSSLVQIFF